MKRLVERVVWWLQQHPPPGGWALWAQLFLAAFAVAVAVAQLVFDMIKAA